MPSSARPDAARLKRRYRDLLKEITRLDSLSQGSVMPQPPHAWRWTRKVAGKTVSRGLSAGQAELMRRAIDNQRTLDAIIDEMRRITQTLILETPPGSPPDHPRSKRPKSALN